MTKQALVEKSVLSPEYRARHDYHVRGLGHEANPYPKDTEKRLDYALEMGRQQTAELKQLINGE